MDQEEKLKNVNEKLSSHALAFPRLGNGEELDRIHSLCSDIDDNIDEIKKHIFATVMHPRMRAIFIESCLKEDKIDGKENIFSEFAYYVHSASLSFYQFNFAPCYFTLLPVIEGFLLRWKEYSGPPDTKPNFWELKKFLRNSISRNPNPPKEDFFKIWLDAAFKIIDDHLYLDRPDLKRVINADGFSKSGFKTTV